MLHCILIITPISVRSHSGYREGGQCGKVQNYDENEIHAQVLGNSLFKYSADLTVWSILHVCTGNNITAF